jgi:hypothetical protein
MEVLEEEKPAEYYSFTGFKWGISVFNSWAVVVDKAERQFFYDEVPA